MLDKDYFLYSNLVVIIMATKIDNIDALDKILTCSICKKHYSEPRVFSCYHYYCKSCIAKLPLEHNLFGCPTCRKEAEDVVGKEDELPSVHFINRLQDIYTMYKKAKSEEVNCEECGSDCKTNHFCKKCGKFICKKCVDSHALMKSVFKGHEVISTNELEKLLVQGCIDDALPVPKCSGHSKKLTLFCYECKKTICRECMIDHKDHKVEVNTNAARDEKLNLAKLLELLSETKGFFNGAIIKLESKEQELEAHEGYIIAAIETYFKELHTLLEQTKIRRLQEVQENVEVKKMSLKAQKEELDMSKAQTERIECYTQQCIQYSSDYDLVREHKDTTKIQQEVDHYHWAGRNKKVKEDVDNIGCSMKSDRELAKICDSLAEVGEVQVVMKFLELPQESNAPRISVKLANGSCFRGNLEVQSELKRKDTDRLNTLEVEEVGQGLYKIHMGTYPGNVPHELIVTINKNGLPIYTYSTHL